MRFDSISRRFAAFLAPAFVLVLGVVVTIDAFAQQRRGRGGIAIRGATIHTMSGDVIEKGTILIAGGKIRAIGADADISLPPRGFEVIDGTGKTVIPGLIDADSALLRADGPGGNSLAYAKAVDALNPYDADAILEALGNGITTIFAAPVGRGGIHGIGAVVKLDPNAPMADRVLDDESALCGGIGISQRLNPVLRAKEYETVGKLFEQAKAYLEARDDYEEEFEEYKEEIEKRAKENEKKNEGDKGKDDKKDAGDEEKDEKKDDKGDTPEADEPKDEAPESPRRRGRGPRPPRGDGAVEGASSTFSLDEERLAAYPPELATWLGAQEEEQKKEGDDKDKKDEKDDLKRPAEPKRQAATEAIARAIAGEVPLRMAAHRAEDILNAIAIAEEHGVRLVISGATEAYKVAGDLADHDVAVVVDAGPRRGDTTNGIYRDSHPGNAAALEKAGVQVVLGSGAMPNRTRFLWLDAALAASHGFSAERALASITIDAAKLLGVDESIGSLEVGKDADLVVLSGSPFSGTTVVESVFVNGRKVNTNP